MKSDYIAVAIFVVFGLGLVVIVALYSLWLRNQRNKPANPLKNNSTPAKSPIRSLLELAAAIMTVIVSILVIYNFFKKP